MALMTSKVASSSSFSLTNQPKNFQIFLSFRGEDIRLSFISHLYNALCQQGINTFIDDKLPRGKEISAELLKTIEDSTISIIIFSENYASSTWCLDELVKIVECKKNDQLVLPVFYNVDPSDIRNQKGKFGEVLTQHEKKFKDSKKIQRWRNALQEAANISGWHYKHKEIVRQESPHKPKERSRIWCYEDALDTLAENMGSDKIQGMMLCSPKPMTMQLKEQFLKMKNLKFLIIHNLHSYGCLEYLPNELRFLDWPGYPFSSLPSNFCPKKLVALNMSRSRLENQFTQIFSSKTLKYVNFSWCEYIRKLPDLSQAPNIKELDLKYCTNLVEVHESVGRLEKLEVWELSNCTKLQILPSYLMMKSLASLTLTGCSSLKKFPDISQEMECLRKLALHSTGICELPSSFGNLIGLKNLLLGNHSLYLPSSIYKLQHIERLSLYGDVIFPKELENDRQPPCDSYKGLSQYIFPSLNYLSLSFFKIRSEIDFILTSCCPLSLESLYITDSNVVTLPKFFGRFERLHMLFIERCNELLEIPSLPRSIIKVLTSNCHSLDSRLSSKLFLQFGEILGLPPNISCFGVRSDISMDPQLSSRISQEVNEYVIILPGHEIPNWINHQSVGRSISFWMGPEFPTFGLCLAFGMEGDYSDYCYHVDISVNGNRRTFRRGILFRNRFDHLWFYCRPPSSLQKQFQDLNLGYRNHVELFCEILFPPFAPKKSTPFIKGMGVHVECICSHSAPQNSGIFRDNNEEVQPRRHRISKRIVHKRLRPSLLRGQGFILRRLLCHTLCPTRSTSHQQLLKAQKISINNSHKRKRPSVERSCI